MIYFQVTRDIQRGKKGWDFSSLWESQKYPTATLSKYGAPKETLGMMGENEMGGIIIFQCLCLQNIYTPLKEFAFARKSFAFPGETCDGINLRWK